MPNFALTTPVAFIIFNRPDTTARVFAEIAKARPPKLLVVGDGPRVSKHGEVERVAATRAIINKVDWPCEVLTNFSETNLGCKKRVSSGIDWIFEQVTEAIILEDDCLPDPTFFRFCEEMLVRYENDQRIGMITGDNFQFNRKCSDDSYYFSKYVHIWGWACWRDRWQNGYDVDMSKWPAIRDSGRVSDLVGGSPAEAKYWSNIFERVYQGEIDTWDYQWCFANWIGGRRSITPVVNLISNIGFGASATHTVDNSELSNLPLVGLEFPLKHPIGFFSNQTFDAFTWGRCLSPSLWQRVFRRIRRF